MNKRSMLNKYKSIIFFLLLLFLDSSCISNKQVVSSYIQSNHYIEDIYYSYSNDSIRFRIDLFGDYILGDKSFYNNTTDIRSINRDNKILKQNAISIRLNPNNFLFKASTFISPYFHFRAYILKTSESKQLFKSIEDSKYRTLIYNIKEDSLHSYLLFFDLDKKESTKSLNGLKKESTEILDRIYIGENYIIPDVESPFKVAQRAFDIDTANYLNAIKMLHDKAINYQRRDQSSSYIQAALTYNSYIGNNITYDSLVYKFYQTKKSIALSEKKDFEVLSFIKDQSKDQRIVIINEQHWQPKHRYLGNTLLQYYYDLGFRYLAVEGIDPAYEKDVNNRKFPLQNTGFYTKEPQYGNMIRNALAIGFQLIAYDNFDSNRELFQAENIYNKCIKNKPESKVLVWAGVAHIIEKKSNNPKMAYYLKKISGIDPLTIEQTQGDYVSNQLDKNYLGIYRPIGMDGMCDIFLYNNYKEEDYEVRPGSEQISIKIQLSPAQKKSLNKYTNLILSVYYKDEFHKYRLECIPVINRRIINSNPIEISLPAHGHFEFIVRTPYGYIIN